MKENVVDMDGNPVTMSKEAREKKEAKKGIYLDENFSISDWQAFGTMMILKGEVVKRSSGIVLATGDKKDNDILRFTIVSVGDNVNKILVPGMEIRLNGNLYLIHKESEDVSYFLADAYTVTMHKK